MKKHQKQKIFKILISVNENKLRSQVEANGNPFSIKDAITNEFGWLYESGIYLEKIQQNYLHDKIKVEF